MCHLRKPRRKKSYSTMITDSPLHRNTLEQEPQYMEKHMEKARLARSDNTYNATGQKG